MAAGRVFDITNKFDIDLAEPDELPEMLKKIMGMITQKAEGLKSFDD